MLGNDVVDLRDPDSRPDTFRSRWEARVFTPEERRAITRDPQPLARRWAHWAAKEAAYKLAKQADSAFIFSPGRLQIRFEPLGAGPGRHRERFGRVEWLGNASAFGIGEIEVRSSETEQRVHVIALPSGADAGAVESQVQRLEATDPDPGVAVRRLALRGISRSLAVAPERLGIGRRRNRIPTIELDGVGTTLALSFSHHGEWIAYAMTPTIGVARGSSHDRLPIHEAGSPHVRVGSAGTR